MESLLDRQVNPDPPKDNRRKLKVIFIAIVLVSLGALVGNGLYRYYSAVNSVAQYEKDYNARMEAERAAKMADTYGGKTPAETLSMYIDAVKKGDYELASKYFVEQNRKTELDKFNGATTDKITSFIGELEVVIKNINSGQGSYNPEKTELNLLNPIMVDFELYPNGIWKITEI